MKRNSPFDSKLIQFTELIRDSRKQGMSYVKIAKMLKKEHMMKVSPSTIFSFVKVRSKKRKVITMLEDDAPPVTHHRYIRTRKPKEKKPSKAFEQDFSSQDEDDFPQMIQEDLLGNSKDNNTSFGDATPRAKRRQKKRELDIKGEFKRREEERKKKEEEEKRKNMTPEELERAKLWDAISEEAKKDYKSELVTRYDEDE